MLNENCLVTVLMPCYNNAPYLKEAIDSILNQSFSNFICLLINDGSTDNTDDVVNSINDNRLIYIKNGKNLGLIDSLNKGLDLVNTKYIIRMDGDDISTLDRFQYLVDFMESNPEIGVCSSYLERFGDDNQKWKVPLENDEIKAGLIFKSTIHHATAIIRTEVLRNNNIKYSHDHIHSEDYDLWVRLQHFTKFQNIDKFLYMYRITKGNVTSLNRSSRINRKLKIYDWILKDFGVFASDEELMLHLGFEKGTMEPSIANIKKYRQWLDKLIKHNQNANKYSEVAFKKTIENQWNKLFYLASDYAVKSGLYYLLRNRKIKIDQLKYLITRIIKG
jgi:glycosyltransferase involved in cell wall biosynthesis